MAKTGKPEHKLVMDFAKAALKAAKLGEEYSVARQEKAAAHTALVGAGVPSGQYQTKTGDVVSLSARESDSVVIPATDIDKDETV